MHDVTFADRLDYVIIRSAKRIFMPPLPIGIGVGLCFRIVCPYVSASMDLRVVGCTSGVAYTVLICI